MLKICGLVLTVIFFTSTLAAVGDRCKVERNGASGVCKTGRDCIIAQEEAKVGIMPTLCGFLHNRIPIVCCEGATINNARPLADRLDSSNLPIYEQKCLQYESLTTETLDTISLLANGKPTSMKVQKCELGVPLIVGGQKAKAGEFPFMAAIGYNGDGETLWYCGGTLISDRYVMTAAHCAKTLYGEPIRVRLGDLNLKDDQEEPEAQDYGIDDITPHPNYQPASKHNDIALIKLNSDVQFNRFVRPACLWNKFDVQEDNVTATGWGATEDGGEPSRILMKVQLSLFNNSRCNKAYKSHYFPNGLPQTMMCAGELAGGKDTCQGDSGGPITVTKRDKPCTFHVVGITSFGKICAAESTPAVYTRVSEFVPWIEKIVWV